MYRMSRPHGALAWAELAAALLISALIVFLNVRFSTHAGPLWRDEGSPPPLATQPTYAEVARALSFDSAPPLFPTPVRLWSSSLSGGDQDGPMRAFGLGAATPLGGAVWGT